MYELNFLVNVTDLFLLFPNNWNLSHFWNISGSLCKQQILVQKSGYAEM